MPLPATIPAGEHVPTADQRVVCYGVSWSHYAAQLSLRGEASVPRLAYLEGALETMSPSRDHERIKSYIGCLLEAYAFERGIDFSPYGAWTLKSEPGQAGLEPDECYIVGDQAKELPDLAIEVAWTSGGVDKLEIYRRLGIAEVWIWKSGRIGVHVLKRQRYQAQDQSRLFPDLDLKLLASFLEHPSAMQAVKAFRKALHGRA